MLLLLQLQQQLPLGRQFLLLAASRATLLGTHVLAKHSPAAPTRRELVSAQCRAATWQQAGRPSRTRALPSSRVCSQYSPSAAA